MKSQAIPQPLSRYSKTSLVMIRPISFLETSSGYANVGIRSHDFLLAAAPAGYPNGLSKFHTSTRIQDVVEREQVVASQLFTELPVWVVQG